MHASIVQEMFPVNRDQLKSDYFTVLSLCGGSAILLIFVLCHSRLKVFALKDKIAGAVIALVMGIIVSYFLADYLSKSYCFDVTDDSVIICNNISIPFSAIYRVRVVCRDSNEHSYSVRLYQDKVLSKNRPMRVFLGPLDEEVAFALQDYILGKMRKAQA